MKVREDFTITGAKVIRDRPRPVGSDKYLVFNQHLLSSHRAHAHKLLDCYIEPIRGEIDSVSANNK